MHDIAVEHLVDGFEPDGREQLGGPLDLVAHGGAVSPARSQLVASVCLTAAFSTSRGTY